MLGQRVPAIRWLLVAAIAPLELPPEGWSASPEAETQGNP